MSKEELLLRKVLAESSGEVEYIALISDDRIMIEASSRSSIMITSEVRELLRALNEIPLKGAQERIDIKLRNGKHIIIEYMEPLKIFCVTRSRPNLGKLYVILSRLRKEVLKLWRVSNS